MAFVDEKKFFESLTIKDKTELYEEFIEEKFRENPQFEEHVLLMAVSVKRNQASREMVKDEEPVEHEELETSFDFFDESISSMNLLCTTNSDEGYEVEENTRDISLRRQTRDQGSTDFHGEMETSFGFFDESYSSMELIYTTNSAEAFGIKEKRQNRGEVPEDLTEETENDSTFFQKTFSSVMDLLNTLHPVETDEVEEARKETKYLVEEDVIETLNKRCSNQMYSSSSIEAYAPPKKHRRLTDVKLHSQLHFPNEQLENLFFTWLRQKLNENVIFPETSKSKTNNHLEIVVNNYRTTKSSSSATAEKSDSAFSSLKVRTENAMGNGNNNLEQLPVNGNQTLQDKGDLQKESLENLLERSLHEGDKPTHNEIRDYNQPPPDVVSNYRTTESSSSAIAEKSDSKVKTENAMGNGNNSLEQLPVDGNQTAQDKDDLQKESLENLLETSLHEGDKPTHNEITDYNQPPPDVVSNYRTTKSSSSATAEKSDSAFSSLKTESAMGNGNNNLEQLPVNSNQTAQDNRDLQNESLENLSERSLHEGDKPTHNEITDYNQPPSGALRSTQDICVRTNCGNDNDHPVTGEVQQEQQHLSDSLECSICPERTNPSKTIDASQLANNVSHFWMKSGDLFISLEIDHINAETLQQIYQRFCKKSAETKEAHFGIDEYQFKLSYRYDFFINFEHLPDDKETSQYWFSSGDLEISFQGKHMSTEKILRLFAFFKSNVEDTSFLHFGIDTLEFSQIPDFWSVPVCPAVENTNNYNGGESSDNFVSPDDEYENLEETEGNQCNPMENNCQSCPVFYDNNRRELVISDICRLYEMENNCQLPCEMCNNNQNGLLINEYGSRETDCQLPGTSASNNPGGLIRDDCDFSCPSCGGSVCELCFPTSSQIGPMNQLCEENSNNNQQIKVDNQNCNSSEQCETDQQTETIEQNNNSNGEALMHGEPSNGYFYNQNILLSLGREAVNHNNDSNEQAEGINTDYDNDQEAYGVDDDSDEQALVVDENIGANVVINDQDYEEPKQIASNSNSSADISYDIALDSAQKIKEFLNCIVTDTNTLSDETSIEQLQTFMCLLRQGANVCFGDVDKIFNALIKKRDAEPVNKYD